MTEQNRSSHAELGAARSLECEFSGCCDNIGEGHALSFMQRRLASSTSTKWRDAIVVEACSDGTVRVISVDDSVEVTLWHHAGIDG